MIQCVKGFSHLHVTQIFETQKTKKPIRTMAAVRISIKIHLMTV